MISPDLSRVDRLWQCTRCGYFAYSLPVDSLYDDDGKEVGAVLHRCPTCADTDWHWCGGDDRETRIGYAAAIRSGGAA